MGAFTAFDLILIHSNNQQRWPIGREGNRGDVWCASQEIEGKYDCSPPCVPR
jgi:hypothetical protein